MVLSILCTVLELQGQKVAYRLEGQFKLLVLSVFTRQSIPLTWFALLSVLLRLPIHLTAVRDGLIATLC